MTQYCILNFEEKKKWLQGKKKLLSITSEKNKKEPSL